MVQLWTILDRVITRTQIYFAKKSQFTEIIKHRFIHFMYHFFHGTNKTFSFWNLSDLSVSDVPV